MSPRHARAALAAVALTSTAGWAAAQQPAATALPAPRVVGPTGPGLQPQVNTSPYQPATTASLGVNPFGAPNLYPTYPTGARFAPRPVGGPEPKIQVFHEDDAIRMIQVVCTCGERICIRCEY